MAIILVDKPKGITSFDVIRELRKMYASASTHIPKIGHAGTLDPRASGLMILATDADTKKLDQFLKLPKVYEAEILLGVKTDTGDLDGKILEEIKIESISDQKIVKALGDMVGELTLPVPAYSAIKIQGKRLYDMARKGIAPLEAELPMRKMVVDEAVFLEKIQENQFRIRFAVSSGTYIRSLSEHLGKILGVPATLAELRRISIGDFTLASAKTLEEMRKEIISV